MYLPQNPAFFDKGTTYISPSSFRVISDSYSFLFGYRLWNKIEPQVAADELFTILPTLRQNMAYDTTGYQNPLTPLTKVHFLYPNSYYNNIYISYYIYNKNIVLYWILFPNTFIIRIPILRLTLFTTFFSSWIKSTKICQRSMRRWWRKEWFPSMLSNLHLTEVYPSQLIISFSLYRPFC